ncbi:hypothetical protein [Pseudomonas graminis]
MNIHSDFPSGRTVASSTHLHSPTVDRQPSQAAGDMQLANALGTQLLTGGRVQVPAHSTLGRWIEVLKSAVHSSASRRLESIAGGASDEVGVNPRTGKVTPYFNARIKSPSVALTDLLGGREIHNALLNAAYVLAPDAELRIPAFYQGGTVALSDVQKFYGEPQHLTLEQATARAGELRNNPVFKGQGELPDPSLLEQVQEAVGDSDTFYNILAAIRAVLAAPGSAFDLALQEVEVAPYSRNWSAEQRQPVKASLKQLILDNDWHLPDNKDELFNLGLALSAHPFQAKSKHIAGGLLTRDAPMSTADQATVIRLVKTWVAQQQPASSGRTLSLIECLSRAMPEQSPTRDINNPEVLLKALIRSPEAKELGEQIQAAIDALPTATSGDEVLLTALLLDADVNAGQQRNNLAGYNLRQKANWGCSAPEIIQRFEKHLEGRFGESLAKVVAFQLLSVCAPEFLVKDIPPSLVYGSHSWALFSAAVSRMELSAAGSSAGETYQKIIERNQISPITDLAQSQAQLALMRSVVDWGVVQGVIQENLQDEYTADEVERSAEAMNQQVSTMTEAAESAATPAPTRRDLALTELRRVYGSENELFFEQKILGAEAPGAANRLNYSLVDIYMSGDLEKNPWLSSSAEFTSDKVAAGFSKLPNIKSKFEAQFDVYAGHLKNMFVNVFKYQFSLLPLEDKKLIERGKVTTFSLEAPTLNNGSAIRNHKIADYIATGAMLIRAELEGKVAHYLYSPAQGRILKDADPSRPGLQFPDAHLHFTMPRPDAPGETESTVDIHWQLDGRPALDLTARRIYPSKSMEEALPKAFLGPVPGVTSPRLSELATVVGAFFTRGLESVKKTSQGQTQQERDSEFHAAVHAFILNFLPFYTAIKSFAEGKIGEGFVNLALDVFGLFVPALKGGFQAIKAGAKGFQSLLSFTKGFAVAGAQAANPLSNVFDVVRGVFKLGAGSIKQLNTLKVISVDALRKINAPRSGGFNLGTLGGSDTIAEGVYRRIGDNVELLPAQAVQRNGKWYAFDPENYTAYGAPLKGFTPDPSPGAAQQLAGSAIGIALDVGFSLTNSFLNQHIYHRSLPPLVSQHTEQTRPAIDMPEGAGSAAPPLSPAIMLRLDAAKSNIVNIEKHALEITAQGSLSQHAPRQIWSGDPLELMGQMEAEVCLVEDRTDTDAHLHHVYFKPYFFHSYIDQGHDGLEKRLEVIERKILAVRKAQATLYKMLNPEAA